MNKFFAPITKELYSHCLDFDRLYAYPKNPETANSSLVIIDSGAYGLGQQKKSFNKYEIERLYKHHQGIYKDKNYLLVAPDKVRDPHSTMQFFDYYKTLDTENKIDLKPVFQFRNRFFDFSDFTKQLKFYEKRCNFDWVFISEKNIQSSQNIDFEKHHQTVSFIRRYLPESMIHFFGSGKSLYCIKEIFKDNNTSCDTTNFQYDAMHAQQCFTNWGVIKKESYVDTCLDILDNVKKLQNGI